MNKKEAILRVQQICSKQEKCSNEILVKLHIWDLSSEESQEIINLLIEQNFINDERYASSFAKDKLRFNKWGKQKIKFQLKSKKISDNIIENALLMIEEAEYESIIQNEISKKYNALKRKESNKLRLKKKLMDFSYQRGYEYNIFIPIIESFFK